MDHLNLPSLDAPAPSPFSNPRFAATPLGAGPYRAADPGLYGARARVASNEGPSTAATVVPSARPGRGGLNIGFDPHLRGDRQIVIDPHMQGDIRVMPLDALSADVINRARAISEQRAHERLVRAQQSTGDVSPEALAEIDQMMIYETSVIASEFAKESGAVAAAPQARPVPLGKVAAPQPQPQHQAAPQAVPLAAAVPGLPNDREAYERFRASNRPAGPSPASAPQAEAAPPAGQFRVSFDTPVGELTATYDRVEVTANKLMVLAYDLRRSTPQSIPKKPADGQPIVAWIEGSPHVFDVIVPDIRFDIDHLRVIILFIQGTRPLEGSGGHL